LAGLWDRLFVVWLAEPLWLVVGVGGGDLEVRKTPQHPHSRRVSGLGPNTINIKQIYDTKQVYQRKDHGRTGSSGQLVEDGGAEIRRERSDSSGELT